MARSYRLTLEVTVGGTDLNPPEIEFLTVDTLPLKTAGLCWRVVVIHCES